MRDACWAFGAIDRSIPKDLDKLSLIFVLEETDVFLAMLLFGNRLLRRG